LSGLSRLHPIANQIKLFLQSHVLGVCALDIEPLFLQTRSVARARRAFERGGTGSLCLSVLPEHSLNDFGSFLDSLFQLCRAIL
jgi:hypothetical protein